jgi:RNA polymerase sigma-70 factor (ECF subfamily)
MPDSAHQVTELLIRWSNGDHGALDQLTPLVYEELRDLARSYLRRESPGQSLQPTALVHEAYIRLVDQSLPDWKNRAHFFGVAARVMRQILVDQARNHHALKRDGGRQVEMDDAVALTDDRSAELLALDEALRTLESFDTRKAKIVELRFFAGLTVEETASALEISPATVHREVRLAETWLYRKLRPRSPV